MGNPMTFRDSIRKKLIEGFVNINELFYMKNFSILQVQVLRSVAEKLGAGVTPTTVNEFLKSPMGIQVMKLYRDTLIGRFGESGKGLPNSDESADPGFDPVNTEAHQQLVNDIAEEIIQKVRG
jgi:hypothetical protein